VLRTGGETVAPTEVEAVLMTHPAVSEVAVVGLPDARWGEVVCAVIVPADRGADLTVEALRAHCDGRLAGFKQPRRVELIDALPRTPATGQIQRTLLVEQLNARARG
jgi:acyl-CoA synthetase (AMP-forming)/AMP-acid ligase II